ncbi:MAG: ribonuclease Y [Dehalococcoidia bacterium]
MSVWIGILVGLGSLILGGVASFWIRGAIASRKLQSAKEAAEGLLGEANTKQKEILLEAKEEAIRIKSAAEAEYRERRSEQQRLERRLSQKEENLERKLEALERRDRDLNNRETEIESVRTQVEELKKKEARQLELISGMSTSEAKQLLLESVEGEVKEEASRRMREWEAEIKAEAEVRARETLSVTIQRLASDVVSETTVSVVPLPGDEMKGRLIGREGRNIRALEQATGVDLIIDDTPEAVTLSAFDPVRREVARVALTQLILDGRIHPARIEEVVEKARGEVETAISEAGEQAAYEAGVQGLHPELIKALGRLKYRKSYGQNVLQHSLETAQFAGMIAQEIGADTKMAIKAGLLHDLGKGVDHEVDGPHALIGARIVEQWEKSPQVVQAISEHHQEANTSSMAGFIVAAADALSGARPGARRESLEHYLKRLEALESIANSFPGVEKSFAIQAGREIRIMVKPEEIDDLGAMRLVRDVVKKVEEGMEYPGQIKITVIRETRAVDYAK